MKRSLLLLAALTAASFAYAADTAAAASVKSAADLAEEASQEAFFPKGNTAAPGPARFKQIVEAPLRFMTEFPTHTGVARAVSNLANISVSAGAGATREKSLEINGQWKQFRAAEVAKQLARTDLAPAAWTNVAAVDMMLTATAIRIPTDGGAKPELTVLRAKIDAIIARNPDSRFIASGEESFTGILEQRNEHAAAEAHLQTLLGSKAPRVAEMAKGKLAVAEMRRTPLEMKFTAVDGREVDLAKLRGKVVLIDFWAIWCGPCVAELPNLTRVYDAYHDKGFEVVGISFDKTPDPVKPASHEKTAADLMAFTKERKMGWPQFYDGKYWDNVYGRQYNIRGIPAMFLLDKEGKLVETSARGARLEPLVKKLLGLDTPAGAGGN